MYKMGLSIYKTDLQIDKKQLSNFSCQSNRPLQFLLPMLLKQVDNGVDLSIIVTIYQKRG